MSNYYDVIVIGGGHAGIEAASAAARIGCCTCLITMTISAIGRLSCNPAIGGMAKGQIVREIDALGGEMGRLADLSGIHFKMLGKSKGPAMWSPRSQNDKDLYPYFAQKRLQEIANLTLSRALLMMLVCETVLFLQSCCKTGGVLGVSRLLFVPALFYPAVFISANSHKLEGELMNPRLSL